MIQSTVLHLIVIEFVLLFLVALMVLGLVACFRAQRAERRARRKPVALPEPPRRAA